MARRPRGSTPSPPTACSLLNFNVEAQCTPSRSALLTGRHPIRSGTPDDPDHRRAGRPDAVGDHHGPGALGRRLRDGHVGQVAPRAATPSSAARSTSASTRLSGSPRTADEVLWTHAVVLPRGDVDADPLRGRDQDPDGAPAIYSRKKGEKPEVVATYDARVPHRLRPQDHRVGDRLHGPGEEGRQALLHLPALHAGPHPARPGPGVRRARPSGATSPTC